MGAGMLTMAVLLTLKDQLSGPLNKVKSDINGLNKAVAKLAKIGAVTGAAALALRPISGAAQGLIGVVGRATASLDDMSARIRSMPGITEDAVKRITDSGRKWSLSHANSAEEYLDASYQMLSAGLNETQALAATQTGLRLAKATMGGAAETANLLALSYNNFGDKAKDSGRQIAMLGDQLAVTQQVFQIKDMAQLAEGLQYATPAALSARMAFAEMNTVIGQLNSSGLQGSNAGTALAASLRQMTLASKKLGFTVAKNADGGLNFIGTLENIKAKYGDLSRLSDKNKLAFQKAFGDEGLRAISLLNNKVEELKTNLDQVTNSAGAAEEGQRKMESGAGQQWQIFTQNMRDLTVEFGTGLLPAFRQILPVLRDMVLTVAAFVKEHPGVTKLIVALVGIAAVAAPILSVVAALATLSAAILALVGSKVGMGALGLLSGAVKALSQFMLGFAEGALKEAIRQSGALAKSIRTNLIPSILKMITVANAGKLGLLGLAGAAGYGVGTWINDNFISGTETGDAIGTGVAKTLAFFGNDEAQQAVTINEKSAAQSRVGGTVQIKIDSEGRPRVHKLQSNNPHVPIIVNTGRTMVMP